MQRAASLLGSLSKAWFFAGIGYGAVLYIWGEQHLVPLDMPALVIYGGVGFCLWCSAQRPNRRTKAFLVTVSIAVPLTVTNSFLEYRRGALPDRIRTSLAGERADFDRRTPEEYIQDQRRAGTDIVPAMCQSFTGFAFDGTILPLAGWPNRLTLLGNENGYYAAYIADRYGFNNPDWVYEGASGHGRVLILGDSFAQGFSVSPGEDVGSVVRRRNFDVLNLGCASNGPLGQLAGLVEYGADFKPNTVVFFFTESNDLSDLAREADSLLNAYLDPEFSQELANRQPEIEAFLERAQRELESDRAHARLWRLASFAHIRGLLESLPSPRWDSQVEMLEVVIKEVKRRVTSLNAEMLVVYIPHQAVVVENARGDDCRGPQSSCKRRVTEVFEKVDVRFMDFEDVLGTLEDPTSVYVHEELGHLTTTGYRLLGDSIADALMRL